VENIQDSVHALLIKIECFEDQRVDSVVLSTHTIILLFIRIATISSLI